MEIENNDRKSAWISFIKFIGFILCFAVLAIVLAMIFPAYALWLVVTIFLLMFATAGFILGMWWYHPAMTADVRGQLRYSPVSILVVLSFSTIYDLVQKHDIKDAIIELQFYAAVAIASYLPFILGRVISRRRYSNS